jgi:hypothetical protein
MPTVRPARQELRPRYPGAESHDVSNAILTHCLPHATRLEAALSGSFSVYLK